MKIRRYFYSLLAFIFLAGSLNAQVTSLGRSVKFLSEKIASEEFRILKTGINDFALIDSIYSFALQFVDGDISESLLELSFTTIPYNRIPVIIPLIRLKIDIPLVSIAEPGFSLKNQNLPGKLFFDTPDGNLQDRDKLAHFFGSAYLAYNSRIFDITEIIGIFVEDFEETFYVQSSVDPRDIRTDMLGNIFGKVLRKNRKVQPSEIFAIYPLIYFRYNL